MASSAKIYWVAVNSAQRAIVRFAEYVKARGVDANPLALLEAEGRRIRLEREARESGG